MYVTRSLEDKSRPAAGRQTAEPPRSDTATSNNVTITVIHQQANDKVNREKKTNDKVLMNKQLTTITEVTANKQQLQTTTPS